MWHEVGLLLEVHMKMLHSIVFMLIVVLVQPVRAADEAPADPPEFYQLFRIPLKADKIKLSALLGTLLDYVGLDGKLLDGFFDAGIDVTGAPGRLTMKTIAFATR